MTALKAVILLFDKVLYLDVMWLLTTAPTCFPIEGEVASRARRWGGWPAAE